MLARLGCRSRRPAARLSQLRQATLCQLEGLFGPAVPSGLLAPNRVRQHSRQRIFSLAQTVWCWLWQVLQGQASCREVVRQVQALFAAQEAGPVDEQTGAYCQARAKVEEALLQKLFVATAQSTEEAAAATASARPPLLQGRRLRAIDATSTRLADTPANRQAYPPSRSLRPGTGFPILRLSVLFSLVSGALLAQASGSLCTSELALLLQLAVHLQPADILVGDRAYGQFVLAAWLAQRGVALISAVATRNRKVDFSQALKTFGPDDALVVWRKPARASKLLSAEQWAALPAEWTVRLLRVHLQRPGFRPDSFVLVTTLLDPVAYPAAEIIQVYTRRWRLEMSLDDLKTTLGMESLRCQSPAMVRKELLVYLSAHNLLRWLLAHAAAQEGAELDRLSFKGTLDSLRQWSNTLTHHAPPGPRRQRLWRAFLRSIARDLLPLRPGRQEPRAVKHRSKHPHLNQPRRHYVARPSRNVRRRIATKKRQTGTN